MLVKKHVDRSFFLALVLPASPLLKPSSHIVFGGIQQYCNTLVQPYGNTQIKFWIPANALNTIKYWVLQKELISIHNTVKDPWRPSAAFGNHMRTHQILLDTFGNPEYLNYLVLKHFLQRTRSGEKMETICSRASIVFIRRNSAKTQIPPGALISNLGFKGGT